MNKGVSYKIGRFQVIRRIGKGAQGTVFLAKDPYLQRHVAIKVLHLKSEDEKARHKALLLEAGSVGKLKHPNIISIFEAENSNGISYLVFEYVNGISLKQLLAKRHLSIPQTLNLIYQVLNGLSYSHQHGIIHRDLKPSNILISKKGVPRITDFGISQEIGSHNIGGNVLRGSLPYMAPEYFSEKPIYPNSDIFSIGLILFEMLTNVRAIESENEFGIIYKINFEPMVAPSLMNPDVDKMLDAIVLKAVQKEPQARFPTADSMKEELKRCLDIKKGIKKAPVEKKETHSTVDFLLRRMKHKADFPAFSASIVEINNMTSSESTSSASELANAILKDYALTNKLLKLANSAFYRQIKGGVSDINKAVVILGFEQVRLAASSLMLFTHFGSDKTATELRDAMIQSFMSGIIARDVAIRKGIKQAEVSFICSMFHNLGKNLTIYYFPEEYEEIKNRMAKENMDIQSSALAVLGISLDELGVNVAREWKFPESIIYSMRSLPDGVMEPPNSMMDRLRHFSVFANELCDIADISHPGGYKDFIAQLIKRFEQSFSITHNEVGLLINASINKILDYASILDINPTESPFVQNLLRYVESSEVPDPEKIRQSEMHQVNQSVDMEEAYSPLPKKIVQRIKKFFFN